MQFVRSMSDWASMAPPWATMPKDWESKWEATKQVHALSQTRGGFGAPSGPGYKSTASVLLWEQPWNAPDYKRPDPRKAQKKKPAAVMLSPLKQLPSDHIPLHELPSFVHSIADLQELTAGGTR